MSNAIALLRISDKQHSSRNHHHSGRVQRPKPLSQVHRRLRGMKEPDRNNAERSNRNQKPSGKGYAVLDLQPRS